MMNFKTTPIWKLSVIFLMLISSDYAAQPCITGWQYRVPVIVDNTQNNVPLSDFQVKVIINSQNLVVAGKANADGGDIRFRNDAGVNLTYWIEPGTFNRPSTEIWIKLPNIAANDADTIYMFYGNAAAASQSTGTNTFMLFDQFNGSFLNTAIWDDCGGGNAIVAGGALTLASSSGSTNNTIKSKTGFTLPYRSEAKVNNVSEGISYLGQLNANDTGWAMAYENLITNNKVMRLIELGDNGTTDTCLYFKDQQPSANVVQAGVTSGLWSYTWLAKDTQLIKWPGGDIQRADSALQDNFTSPLHTVMGNINKSGSVNIDWIRARKYVENDPILTTGQEVQLLDSVHASNTGPYCQGDSILLTASQYTGATYQWFGPNGFTSTDREPKIPNSNPNMTGTYLVIASIPNGCAPQTDSTVVTVDSTTVAGTLSGATSVCQSPNNGTLRLSGYVGDIVRWETSLSSGGPWNSVAHTEDTLTFNNLTNTTYYRVIVKSGSCLTEISNVQEVAIDQPTVGGTIFGSTEVCQFSNSGTLRILNNIGDVVRWHFTEDTFQTSTIVNNIKTSLEFSNLSTSRFYWAEVQNGGCAIESTDTASVIVNNKPIAGFTTIDTCFGIATPFVDTSSVTGGTISIRTWNYSTGAGSALTNPSYIFPNSGSFPVELTVTTDKGCRDTVVQNVIVDPKPVAAYTVTEVCDTIAVSFTNGSTISSGGISQFSYDFGSGGNGSQASDTSFIYPNDGTYQTKLIIVSDNGCIDSTQRAVRVNPRAITSFSTDTVCEGEPTQFNNLTSFDPLKVTYSWTFGDGNTSSAINPQNNYASFGKYEVRLSSTTDKGCTWFNTDTVAVFASPSAKYFVNNECLYDSLVFIDSSSVAEGSLNYSWKFGNGKTSTLQNPKHKYGNPNNYFTELTITTDNGCIDTANRFVTVYSVPVANFSFINACEDLPIAFTNSSTINPGTLTYAWNFDDAVSVNNLDSTENPTHLYSDDGLFNAELIAISEFNCRDTVVKTVEAFPLPEPFFTFNDTCDGFPISFKDSTLMKKGFINDWLWNFGDAITSVLENPRHQYLNPGVYDVNLKITSDKGCKDDTTIQAEVFDVPVANFAITNACFGDAVQFSNQTSLANGFYDLRYDFGNGTSDTILDPQVQYGRPDEYSVQLLATSDHNCKDSITKIATTYQLPNVDAGLDTMVSQGYTIQLNGFVDGGRSYLWTPNTGITDNTVIDPFVRPLETTEYTLIGTDSNGCVSSDAMTVEVIKDFKLEVTNIVTPDGNGQNDTWEIINSETFNLLNIFVYDRYGKEVFNKKGYDADFGGISDFDLLPDGTYYYVITFDNSERRYKGAVTVLRNQN